MNRFIVSDANIFIDMEVGGLLASMFSLQIEYIVPDVLYEEELEERHSHLLNLGLQVESLPGEIVARVYGLSEVYRGPSTNVITALALAEHKSCRLLTGDRALRNAAIDVEVTVNGTIWLVEKIVSEGHISKTVANDAYEKMKEGGRRLPFGEAFQRLDML